MRIKNWEKWYWGIVLVIITSFLIWISLREKGFVFPTQNGGEKELSKLHSTLMVLANIIPAIFVWAVFRFHFLKTNDFICKYCRKEYAGRMETEKKVCQTCYEKKRH